MSVQGCLLVCRCLHGCEQFAWVCSGVRRVCMMCEWISTRFSNNEFSEYFLETRVQVSVAFNTYPIRIFEYITQFFFQDTSFEIWFFFSLNEFFLFFRWLLFRNKSSKTKNYQKGWQFHRKIHFQFQRLWTICYYWSCVRMLFSGFIFIDVFLICQVNEINQTL